MHRAIFKLPLLLSAVALARPQTATDTSALSGLPACAQDAANAALASSGCSVNDQNCVCSSTPFINAITTAVTQTCDAADVQAALEFSQTFCGAALGAANGGSSSSSAAPTTTDAGDAAAASTSPTSAATDSSDASTTTVPGTLTSMTSVAGATDSMTTSAATTDLSSAIGSLSGTTVISTGECTSTTTTMMTTLASTPTMAYNATYTGAAVKNAGSGMMAAVMGVAGAVALL
ncbi:uncharacterized protein Z520_00099 [Fonsecaea multimorphosa CBS 102226]|uniref:CFEM domain-containing protein n=1 Tax=Fonsecaea multimorphosa CBS 102226 TaxID=1442371 RepID=A0A0D2KBL3_9EURO|nr:uncharacterized protein Z520_00099 [Fonsecaea multimorphosa CBS 102226]KIY03408.1 hypothetical protein Z520_00099 [Fonsecaea multimorphosa CBS 102226]OAL33057.1 hypothetical protein AYO22_00142 [Fonsecaea multimorphosa]